MKYLSIIALVAAVSFNSIASSTQKSADIDKKTVQGAMKSFVLGITKDGAKMPVVYKGKLINLSVLKSKKYPDGFHSGVKMKKNLYVSCADFVDAKGTKYDIDFLVSKVDNKYKVVQPIVHSINGVKSPYDLDH